MILGKQRKWFGWNSIWQWSCLVLKTESFHDANFVVNGGITRSRYPTPKWIVVIMPTSSSLLVLLFVTTKTCSVADDNKVGIVTTLRSKCSMATACNFTNEWPQRRHRHTSTFTCDVNDLSLITLKFIYHVYWNAPIGPYAFIVVMFDQIYEPT